MKEKTKYDITYVENLIKNKVEENFHLEYKSAQLTNNVNTLCEKLTKTISSFANSEGGKLILGIQEYSEQGKKHLPEKITPIDRIKFPRERIEQLIQDNISPKIEGLKIFPVDYKQGHILIIDVKQSSTAHQARDLKYYRRMNFISEPMRDYEIRDIMNRKNGVELNVTPAIKITHNEDYINRATPPINTYLSVFVKNTGKKTAKYIFGNLFVPPEILYNSNQDSQEIVKIEGKYYAVLSFNNKSKEVIQESKGASISIYLQSEYQVLIPYAGQYLNEIQIKNEYRDFDRLIKWEVYCDESEPIFDTEHISNVLVNPLHYPLEPF